MADSCHLQTFLYNYSELSLKLKSVTLKTNSFHAKKFQIFHRKLCARNVFMVNNCPKIGGLGIADYSKPGQEADFTRWTAQETFQSRNYAAKCDVWSFGILMWEVLTLGGF